MTLMHVTAKCVCEVRISKTNLWIDFEAKLKAWKRRIIRTPGLHVRSSMSACSWQLAAKSVQQEFANTANR